jgi:hypothetical protein
MPEPVIGLRRCAEPLRTHTAGHGPFGPSRDDTLIPQTVLREPNRAVSAVQFGLLRRLFLGILSTSSGSARSISRRAIRSIKVAVVRPRRSASCAAVSTFWAKPSRLPGYAIAVPHLRCEMKDPTYVAELQKKLGAPSSETVESLRLLKAFLKLAPDQRSEIIELVERFATDPSPSDSTLS